ncbi:MAG: inositol monophosphatase [Melioribacteraceae bacterium]|nr:inositol monophosphatase [Melioribacteraceae bacterium]
MINNVINIAKEAGEIIREGFSNSISIEYKTDVSNLVTNIDKAAEKIITDYIQKQYPLHSIRAEESGNNKKSSEYTWVIDPIDGTTNFAHKLPLFSVSIGIQKNGETIIGVIYDVMRDAIYSAEKGSGAYQNDKKINVNDNSDLAKSLLVTGFAYDREDEYIEAIRIFGVFLNKARAVRRLGSAAIDFCYVAAGVFDGFWEANLSPWDVCAGLLLVEEAGGKTSDFDGNKIKIYSDSFLATNGKVHDDMLKVIRNN